MEAIKKFFERDQFAARNGIELVEVAPGYAKVRMAVQPHHWNGIGSTHGGALFTLGDFAFAVACNSHGTVAVAISANISFMKATSKGTLTGEAREVSKNHRLGTYLVEIKDETGDLVALFQGLAYRKGDPLPLQ